MALIKSNQLNNLKDLSPELQTIHLPTVSGVVYAGPVALSTMCRLIAPGVSVKGTMSITKSELYFEMDDEDAENRKTDPNVSPFLIYLLLYKWSCGLFFFFFFFFFFASWVHLSIRVFPLPSAKVVYNNISVLIG